MITSWFCLTILKAGTCTLLECKKAASFVMFYSIYTPHIIRIMCVHYNSGKYCAMLGDNIVNLKTTYQKQVPAEELDFERG